MPDKQPIDYQQLSQELDQIMHDLQDDAIEIDEAVRKYQRGIELIERLSDYLDQAENKVEKIKRPFDKDKI